MTQQQFRNRQHTRSVIFIVLEEHSKKSIKQKEFVMVCHIIYYMQQQQDK